MAIYRNVAMSFWTDSKIVDDFTPEERYMYLYLFTNPHTNLCGCYEISTKQIADETGYGVIKVRNLLSNLEGKHGVIRYSEETKEVLILKWYKYNWTKSDKFRIPLEKEIESVKCVEFSTFLRDLLNGNDTVSIPYAYHSDTRARTVSVSVTDTVSDTVSVTDTVIEVIEYLNTTCGTSYKENTKKTNELIRARMNEGFSLDDFKTVIYKKAKQWKDDPKMCKFLRPETLFGTKFEGYLNEKAAVSAFERWDLA